MYNSISNCGHRHCSKQILQWLSTNYVTTKRKIYRRFMLDVLFKNKNYSACLFFFGFRLSTHVSTTLCSSSEQENDPSPTCCCEFAGMLDRSIWQIVKSTETDEDVESPTIIMLNSKYLSLYSIYLRLKVHMCSMFFFSSRGGCHCCGCCGGGGVASKGLAAVLHALNLFVLHRIQKI